MRSLRRFVLEPTAKPNNVAVRVLCTVLGKLRTTFMKLVGVFLLNEYLYKSEILIRCYGQLLKLPGLQIPLNFNIYLEINEGAAGLIL
jgi:hypothetical protein